MRKTHTEGFQTWETMEKNENLDAYQYTGTCATERHLLRLVRADCRVLGGVDERDDCHGRLDDGSTKEVG